VIVLRGAGVCPWISVDAGGVQTAIRQGGGGADTGFVSAATTTPPVVSAPIRAARDLRDML
jgi:phosphoribosylcarboxyaminoimidazole (NCAIR) mutase